MEAENRSRSLARWLAPLAIVAVAIVTYGVVSGSEVEGDSGQTKAKGTTTALDEPQLDAEGQETDPGPSSGRGSYVVKEGDTLSAIAAKEGVSVEELQALNPDIDPHALVTGERLKLP